ncbi:MAG: T9SS type A sorting domain-containing protein [Bacteroidetes bacterium]|nr:T9SS type A sorting domain-containing protein [Bacteroidota bacterium]
MTIISIIFNNIANAQNFCVNAGTINDDEGHSIAQSSNGDFAVAGWTNGAGAGGQDIYVVRFDPNFNLLGTFTVGGAGDEFGYIHTISGGDFIIAGKTASWGAGFDDAYIVRINALSGAIVWTRVAGGTDNDWLHYIIETSNGDFVAVGYTVHPVDGAEIYLIRLNSAGTVLWQKRIGGAGLQEGYAVVEASNGDLVVGGLTTTGGGGKNVYVVSLNSAGTAINWTRIVGGSYVDAAFAMTLTPDGGFATAGYTLSYGQGGEDVYVVKIDNSGNLDWTAAIGGTGNDRGHAIFTNANGNLVVTGHTNSFGAGGLDFYIIELDNTNGTIITDQTAGEAGDEYAAATVPTGDGGFILGGTTSSNTLGGTDMYAVRVSPNGTLCCTHLGGGTTASGGNTFTGGVLNSLSYASTTGGNAGGNGDLNIKCCQIAITKTSTYSCSGGKIGTATVTPIGEPPYSYTWSDGQADPQATGLDQGTYTVTVTDNNGCTIIDTFQIKSVVLPLTITQVNTCTGACIGEATATLTGGTAPYDYAWSDGQATSTAVNLCSGLIEVTVTDVNGCSNSGKITITSVPPSFDDPVIGVSEEYPLTCDGEMLFSVLNPDPNLTYSWSAIGATITCPDPSCTTNVSIVWQWPGPNDMPPAGYVILTATDADGCTKTVNMLIDECCDIDIGNGCVIVNESVSELIAMGFPSGCSGTLCSSPDLFIFGKLTVDQSFTFSNLNIGMGKKAKIDIPSGTTSITLTFNDTWVHAVCDYMWDGIYVNEPDDEIKTIGTNTATCSTSVIQDALIQDAENAIVSYNGGKISATKYHFMNNYKHIIVNSYSGAANFNLSGNRIYTDYTIPMIAPHANQTGALGIEIWYNGNITVGTPGSKSALNYFRNLITGVYSNGSNINIYNNGFRDVKDIAIAVKTPLSSPATLTANIGNTAKKNYIDDCHWGIYCSGLQHSKILYNDVDSTDIGIYVVGVTSKVSAAPTQVLVQNNNVTRYHDAGIFMLEHYNNDYLKVNNNTVSNNFTDFLDDVAGSIVAWNFYASNTIGIREIRNNSVFPSTTGVGLLNFGKTTVKGNNILFNKTNADIGSTLHYGIYAYNSNNTLIENNTINRPSGYNPGSSVEPFLNGIYVWNTQNCIVNINKIYRMGRGIVFKQNTVTSQITCNLMDYCYTGIHFDNAATSNQKLNGKPSDNRWTNVQNASSYRITGNLSTQINWYYRNGWNFNPAPIDPNLSGWLSPINVNGPWACYSTPAAPPQKREQLLGPIVRNERQFSGNENENKWAERLFAYRALKYDSLLQLGAPDDTTFQNYYDTVSLNNTGKIISIRENIYRGDYAVAESENSSFIPHNRQEQNYKDVYAIYLSALDTTTLEFLPDSLQKLVLEDIACEDPLVGGEAVYSAVAILGLEPGCLTPSAKKGVAENGNMEVNNEQKDNSAHNTPLNDGEYISKIFPNPVNGSAELNYRINENSYGKVEIFDVYGKMATLIFLKPGKNKLVFENNTLPPGIYPYRISVNDTPVIIDRIVVIK